MAILTNESKCVLPSFQLAHSMAIHIKRVVLDFALGIITFLPQLMRHIKYHSLFTRPQ